MYQKNQLAEPLWDFINLVRGSLSLVVFSSYIVLGRQHCQASPSSNEYYILLKGICIIEQGQHPIFDAIRNRWELWKLTKQGQSNSEKPSN